MLITNVLVCSLCLDVWKLDIWYFGLHSHGYYSHSKDGIGNSFLDLDQPSCYLGIYYILFYIFFVLWWNSLVSGYTMS